MTLATNQAVDVSPIVDSIFRDSRRAAAPRSKFLPSSNAASAPSTMTEDSAAGVQMPLADELLESIGRIQGAGSAASSFALLGFDTSESLASSPRRAEMLRDPRRLILASSATLADGWPVCSPALLGEALAISLGREPLSVPRTRARRVPVDRPLVLVRSALQQGRLSASRRAAYQQFDLALYHAGTSRTRSARRAVLAYLADEKAPFRDTLLGCMADRDFALSESADIEIVTRLLANESRELARSAALALTAAGERATEMLRDAIRCLYDERRADIARFVAFSMQ